MNDKEQIENVVQLYIDYMNESNPDKAKEVLHENAKVVAYLSGNLIQMSADNLTGFVVSQNLPPKEKGEDMVFETLTYKSIQ